MVEEEDGFFFIDSVGGEVSGVDIDSYLNLPAGSVFFDQVKIVDDGLDFDCEDSPGADIDAVCAISSVSNLFFDIESDILLDTCQGTMTIQAFPTFEYEPNSVQWYFEDSPISGAESLSIQPGQSGLYRVEIGYYDCYIDSTIIYTDEVDVTIPEPLSIQSIDSNNPCAMDNGSIDITPAGGTQPYAYSIDGGATFQTGPVFENLGAGEYEITVTDGNGCSVEENIALTYFIEADPDTSVSLSLTTDLCAGTFSINSDIDLELDGLNYQWSRNGEVLEEESAFLQGSASGNYTLEVFTELPCQDEPYTASASVVVNIPMGFGLDTLAVNPPRCSSSNGTITVLPIGGTPPYTYSIGGEVQEVSAFSGISEGEYEIILTDANDCQLDTLVDVPAGPLAPQVSVSVTDPSCTAQGGSITVSASGSNGMPQYALNGSDFQSANVFNELSPGTYTVYVKDSTCTVQEQVMVGGVDPLRLDTVATVPQSCDSKDGKITVVARGGSGNYMYTLNDSTTQVSGEFTDLASGNYLLRAEDDLGCADSVNVRLSEGTSIYIPNAITPDGDGINDLLKVVSSCEFEVFSLEIFDRYGQRVFITKNINEGWNGSYNGGDFFVKNGLYVWKLKYKFQGPNGAEQEKIGHVTVVR